MDMRMLASGLGLVLLVAAAQARAADCPVTHDQLAEALKQSVKPSGGPGNGGLDNNEWAAVVARDGTVCAIAFSGAKPDDQWLGSRGIAAEKANTANALSLQKFALSTANLYAATQPGGPLYGLEASNPVATDVLYAGDAKQFGSVNDAMIGKHLGGVIVFGGGLALYDGRDVVGRPGRQRQHRERRYITSPGGCVRGKLRRSGARWHHRPTTTTPSSTTTSSPTRRAYRAVAIRCAAARGTRSRSTSMAASFRPGRKRCSSMTRRAAFGIAAWQSCAPPRSRGAACAAAAAGHGHWRVPLIGSGVDREYGAGGSPHARRRRAAPAGHA